MLLTHRLNLRDDERVIAVVRRSWLAYMAPITLAIACIFLGFFLITPLLARGGVGTIIFVSLIGAGVIAGVRAAWLWYWNALVVTSIRVIDVDQRGFFHRSVSDARYEKVEDISVEIRGMVATLFHLGTVRLQTAGAHARIELQTVPRPELIQELIGRLQEEAGTHHAPPSVPEDDLAKRPEEALVQLRERIDVELRTRRDRTKSSDV